MILLMVILSSQLDTLKSRGIKKQIFLWQVPYHYWRATLFGYDIGSKMRVSEVTKRVTKNASTASFFLRSSANLDLQHSVR